jgi:plasmid stability protein
MLQVRSVPDALHRTLKSRAAAEGMALSDYARAILEREASRPTRAEMLRRFDALSTVKTKESPASTIGRSRPRR